MKRIRLRPTEAAWYGFLVACSLLMWLALASSLFLYMHGLLELYPFPFYQWPEYWLAYHSSNPGVATELHNAAFWTGVPLLAMFLFSVWQRARPGLVRPLRKNEDAPPAVRAASSAFGTARWMTLAEAKKLWSATEGVVIGEAYRVDEDSVRDIPFQEKNPRTWGKGGKAPLLIDACNEGATHGLLVAGTGGYKTGSLTIPTLFTWHSSVVVFDPSCQVGPMTHKIRRAMGQRVYELAPGKNGLNVLDHIDTSDELAEQQVWSVLEGIAGPLKDDAKGENKLFAIASRELMAAILADMLWDPALPPELRTLREFRRRMIVPERQMLQMLGEIAETSLSQMARDHAKSLMEMKAEKTWSGIYRDAGSATMWLSTKAFADIVCGDSFKAKDLVNGRTTVYVQIPTQAINTAQGLAPTVIGALMGALYQARGKTRGRVLFLLDECRFLGRLKVLAEALRDARKFGATIVTMWQDMGDIRTIWGPEGPKSFFANATWRAFAFVDDLDTRKWVSDECGTYGALVTTKTESASKGMNLMGSNPGTKSTSWNTNEQKRQLIDPGELRIMRGDEAIVLRRGYQPARIGRAIYFRRPEMAARVGKDEFRKDLLSES